MPSGKTIDRRDLPKSKQKGSQICQICKVNIKKYKCPTCEVVYCSLKCYKQHKESGTCEALKLQLDKERREDSDTKSEIENQNKKRKREDSGARESGDEEGYIVPMEDYNRLVSSKNFKKYFLDVRFQKVVKEIDSANDRRIALDNYIKNDKHFSQIVDEMLLILKVAAKDQAGNLVVE